MLKVPRFFKGEQHEQQVIAKLKISHCPACNKIGTLIRYGLLKGNDASDYKNTKTVRAQRVLCSQRKKAKPGCGVSFSIYKNTCLPRLSINAALLMVFFKAYQRLHTVHAAGQELAASLSLSTAYRLCKRLDCAQANGRQRLCRLCTTLQDIADHEPRKALIAHLTAALKHNPISAYQARFQVPFLST